MNLIEDILPFASDPQSHASYKLSILLGVDSLLYGLWDGSRWVALRQMQSAQLNHLRKGYANLSAWLEQEDFWAVAPVSVRIGLATTRFTLLPKRLFSLQHKRSYLEKLLPLHTSDVLQADVVEWLGLVLVYALDNSFLRLLSARFPTAVFSHYGSAALRHWRNRREEGGHVHLHVMGQMLYLAALEYEHLLFFNAFRWETPADSLYYTSLVFEQTGLNRAHTPLFLGGMLEKNAQFVRALQPYFPKIQWETPDHQTFPLEIL